MAEQSFLFDFTRLDSFVENINTAFFIDEMFKVTGVDSETGNYTYEDDNIEDNFELVIIKYGGDNISEYIDSDGLLKSEIEADSMTETCALDYYNRGEGNATIELHDTVTFNIGDVNIPIKAVLLRSYSTGYVMGYSINTRSFSVTNEVVFDDDVIFWDISRYIQ